MDGVAQAPSDEESQPRRSRRRRRVVWLLVALALIVVFLDPVRTRIRTAAVLADALDLPVVRPFAAEVERRPTTAGGVEGDRYDPLPEPTRPPMVLVPGATPAGREDPRVIRLAEAMARTGMTVFVPELEVYHQDLVRQDVDDIAAAAAALAAEQDQPVVLFGTSFGGSLCLLAAADPRLEGQVGVVGSFGGYFDLLGVVQAATTGYSLVGDERIPWPADPRANEIVTDRVLGLLDPALQPAIRGTLAGRRDAATLPETGRAVVELLRNDDPARTYPLAGALPLELLDRITRVSPASVAKNLDAEVVAMHAVDDPVLPYGELLRLGEHLPDARLITVRSFEHVDFEDWKTSDTPGIIADLWRVWGFATALLD
jgi:pimeloyl-ACP methyl ester carboxylesterase